MRPSALRQLSPRHAPHASVVRPPPKNPEAAWPAVKEPAFDAAKLLRRIEAALQSRRFFAGLVLLALVAVALFAATVVVVQLGAC